MAILDGSEITVKEEDVLYIQRGAKHNVINTGSERMKIISVYAPPQHARGTVHSTKTDALKAEQ